MSSDDDDLEMYPQKFFDVGAVPVDMDLNSVPTSGLEYLRRVKLELAQCPEIVRADIDEKKLLQKQPTIKVPCFGLTPPPPGFSASAEWHRAQVAEFSALRHDLTKDKPSLQKRFKKKDLPKIQDIDGWLQFCLGPEGPVASGESSVSFGRNAVSRDSAGGAQPLLSSLIWLIQPEFEVLLSYHVEWLKSYGFSDQQGRWIYALMVCLEKPLTPNACDILRKLARICSELRSKLKSKEDPTLTPLNLIITLVANYFDQKDMSDKYITDEIELLSFGIEDNEIEDKEIDGNEIDEEECMESDDSED